MDNNPETIADIVREMRSKIDCLADEPGYNYISCRSAEEWAARIEEAAKRIVITDNSETLRNALIRIDQLGDSLSRVIEERDRLAECLREALSIFCGDNCERCNVEGCDTRRCRAALAKAEGEEAK